METSVIMSSTDPDGNEINRTYGGINPTATSEEITDFTEELNSLSDNTYVSTTRRDITHSDREAGLVAYTLPTAASDVKGGVMIGAGLSMTGDTLNVVFDEYTLPAAGASTLGGIKIGGGLSMIGDSLNVTFEAPAVFTGATSDTGGASGIVPAPQAGDDDKFLCGNGQWVTIQSGETYSDATTVASGLMSASDKVKLNGIDTGANSYTLPTASSSTKGGIKVGTGLSMNGDTLNCTVSGGGVVLSTVSSTTPGAMWLSS